VCKLLCRHGADINAVDNDNNTALHEAIMWGRMAVAEMLIVAGIDTSVRNIDKKEALDLASPEFLHSFFTRNQVLEKEQPESQNDLNRLIALRRKVALLNKLNA